MKTISVRIRKCEMETEKMLSAGVGKSVAAISRKALLYYCRVNNRDLYNAMHEGKIDEIETKFEYLEERT